MPAEILSWSVRWRVIKHHEDIDALGYRAREAEFLERFKPYEIIEGQGNLLLNEGIDRLLNLLVAAGGTGYNNANARIGVGDSTTAAANTQTDLQASTNKTYKAMNGGFPSRPTTTSVRFQATFGTGDANYAWQEWVIDNGATAAETLNRKVESLGTKTTGSWTLEATITIS